MNIESKSLWSEPEDVIAQHRASRRSCIRRSDSRSPENRLRGRSLVRRGFPARNWPRVPSVNTAPLKRTNFQEVGLACLKDVAGKVGLGVLAYDFAAAWGWYRNGSQGGSLGSAI